MTLAERVMKEVAKVFVGKNDIIRKVMLALLAQGHVLLEDRPGVGKTTLALAMSKAIRAEYRRIQFTPDVMPSDITGFSMYDKERGEWNYERGAILCNLFLADEINRTSPKTQSALLEAMEEHRVTVDGLTHRLPDPFICIATQNPLGTTGTQPLPESQMDRFMVRLSIGYPTTEDQVRILKARRYVNPLDEITEIASRENIREVQNFLTSVRIHDDVLHYLIRLCERTRELPAVELGVSPRGVLALTQMTKAHAVLKERNYVLPQDVRAVFNDVCAHRLILRPQARVEGIVPQTLLEAVLGLQVPTTMPG